MEPLGWGLRVTEVRNFERRVTKVQGTNLQKFHMKFHIRKLFFIRELFQFHMWNENFICEINFRLWICHFICEIDVSCAMISHVKFSSSSFLMWIRHFICETFSLHMRNENFICENVSVPSVFHVWNDVKFSYRKVQSNWKVSCVTWDRFSPGNWCQVPYWHLKHRTWLESDLRSHLRTLIETFIGRIRWD